VVGESTAALVARELQHCWSEALEQQDQKLENHVKACEPVERSHSADL